MMPSAPLVSVLIPCFNAEDYVVEAIASALAQTIADIEVIVVDDASTDGSRDMIERAALEDSRVRPHFLARNGGPSAARNHGIAAARGEWIAILDADDLFEPTRLARLLEVAAERAADVVGDNLTIRSLDGSRPDYPAFDYLQPGRTFPVDRAFFFSHIWEGEGRYPLGLLKPMLRRDFLIRHRLSYDTRFRLGEDFRLYLDCVLAGARFYLVGDAHYLYRHHAGSLSHVGGASFVRLAEMCDEIVERRGGELDNFAIDRLRHRRDGYLRLARRLDVLELRALRRAGDLRGFTARLIRDPPIGLELVRSSLAWRLGQRRGAS